MPAGLGALGNDSVDVRKARASSTVVAVHHTLAPVAGRDRAKRPPIRSENSQCLV